MVQEWERERLGLRGKPCPLEDGEGEREPTYLFPRLRLFSPIGGKTERCQLVERHSDETEGNMDLVRIRTIPRFGEWFGENQPLFLWAVLLK